jgi:hypothetical protein
VRVDACVAVEEDVLLEGRVLVHALELGHGHDGLLPLRTGAGAGALIGRRHVVDIKEKCTRGGVLLIFGFLLRHREGVPAT